MADINGNTPFAHTDKISGDIIRSEDWNAAMNEVIHLQKAKVNRQGVDTIQGPLTIEAALTLNDKVGVGSAPDPDANAAKLQVKGNAAITGSLSVTGASTLTGNVVIGNISGSVGSVGGSLLKVAFSQTDLVDIYLNNTGAGKLEMLGWAEGWNINAKTDGKHLYLNRDASSTSDVRIGRGAAESTLLTIKGNDGKVGIGTINPTEKLEVSGTIKATNATLTDTLSVSGTSKLTGDTTISGTLTVGALTIREGKVSSNEASSAGYKYTHLQGAVSITSGPGCNYANQQGFMAPGSLTIGSIDQGYGGGQAGWNPKESGTAGLLFETLDNTEIAVHGYKKRLASFMYYESDGNKFTIGRDLSSGKSPSDVVIAGQLSVMQDLSTQTLQLGPNMRIRWIADHNVTYVINEHNGKPNLPWSLRPNRTKGTPATFKQWSYQVPWIPGYFEISIDFPFVNDDGTTKKWTSTLRVEEMDLWARLVGNYIDQGGNYTWEVIDERARAIVDSSKKGG